MAAAVALPGSPMPVEQLGVDMRVHLTVLFGVQVSSIAGVVGAAFGIHSAGEHQVISIGREPNAGGFGGEVGDLPRVPSIGIHEPDLRRAATVRNIRDPSGIGRPARAFVGFAVVRDLARRPTRRSVRTGHDPDLRWLPVRRHVDGFDRKRHPFAVGGDLWIADPFQLHHCVRVKRPLLRERQGAPQPSPTRQPAHTNRLFKLSRHMVPQQPVARNNRFSN